MDKKGKKIPEVLVGKIQKYVTLATTNYPLPTDQKAFKKRVTVEFHALFQRKGYAECTRTLDSLISFEKSRLKFETLPTAFKAYVDSLPNTSMDNKMFLWRTILKVAMIDGEDKAISYMQESLLKTKQSEEE